MVRFYLRRLAIVLSIVLAASLAGAAPARAQTAPIARPAPVPPAPVPDEQPDHPLLGRSLPAAALGDLPASGDLLSLIDALSADVIADGVDTGGLRVGAAPRMGGHASSWTQTQFLVDGANITDPDGSGTPLLLPGVLEWDRVDVLTGAMPIEVNAAGLAISLKPRRPTAEWTRRVDVFGAPPVFVSDPFLTTAPTIARLNSYANGSVLASGPLLPNRLGIVVAGSWIASSRFDRTDPTELDSARASFFTHLVFTPTPTDELRLLGWAEHTMAPFADRLQFRQPSSSETDDAVHAQTTWERKLFGGRIVAGSGSYSIRQRSFDRQPVSSIVVDSVLDPPIGTLLYPGPGTDVEWTAAAHMRPTSPGATGVGAVRAGVEVSGGAVEARQAFDGLFIGEAVNGLPARVWSFSDPGVPSHWSDSTIAVYASDRVAVLPRLVVDVGARFESVNGSADGSTSSISWHNFLPRASLQWSIVDWSQISFFANYSRTAYQLPLTALAWGDPNAPAGFVNRWNATTANNPPLPREVGTLIERVGPGPGGAPGSTSIDPALARPYLDEFVFGFEGHPNRATLVRLSAMARREQQLLGVVDTGVPESTYSVSHVADPGADLAGSQDDQLLPVFNRSPSTFGRDTYTLTNPADNEATLVGVDFNVESHTDRLFFMLGATASRSEGLAGNRGFLATENDEGVLGDVFIDPNSRTFAQGRTFTERGYTIKTAGTFRFDHDVRVGIAARYQDGQHFARLVIAPDLTQGPEAIRAFRNGKTRFTYTMTVDARLQKGFTVAGYSLAAILDAYNLFNQHTEIEEFPVTGPSSRSTTAIQPPRAIHLGIRLTF